MSSIIKCEKCGFDTFAVQDDGVMICDICGEDSTTVPINAELRKMVLKLCKSVDSYDRAANTHNTNRLAKKANQIIERLEAGE